MDYQTTANEAFEEAFEILNSEEDWKEAKRNQYGDVVMTKKNKRGKNIYRVKAVIDVSPEKLIPALQPFIPSSLATIILILAYPMSGIERGMEEGPPRRCNESDEC